MSAQRTPNGALHLFATGVARQFVRADVVSVRFVCVVTLLAWPLLAQAAGGGVAPERAAAPLWREIGRPGQARARDLLQQALAELREGERQLPGEWHTLCMRTLSPSGLSESLSAVRGRARALRELRHQAVRKRVHLDNAIVRLERAAALAKDEPEILYALGRVLMLWEQPGPPYTCQSARRDQEATDVLRKLRLARPDFSPDAVAMDLGILLTRRGLFAEAARAYEDAVALAIDGAETAVMRANLAEVTMLSGQLERAIDHYQHALKLANGGRDYLLPLWGLCVALDRLGEHETAIANAEKAVTAEGGHMQVLRSDGVFFEPEYEIHYYEALGHEALARNPDANRGQELAAAAADLHAFIAAAGESGLFTTAAHASLDHIEAELRGAVADAAKKKKATAAPRK